MVDRKPMVLVLTGPNGSGKSTIIQFFDKVGEYTNADDVVSSTGMSNEDAARFVDKRSIHRLIIRKILLLKQYFHQIIKWSY